MMANDQGKLLDKEEDSPEENIIENEEDELEFLGLA